VELAEAKLAGTAVPVELVRAAISPMVEQTAGGEMDVMVLACTHFPLLGEEIAAAFPGIAQVDGGPGIARRIAYLTQGQAWPTASPAGIAVFTAAARAPLASALARFGLGEVREL
jgi:glutamate racemase